MTKPAGDTADEPRPRSPAAATKDGSAWSSGTRILFFALLAVCGAWLLYGARALVAPLGVAALLAYVLYPAVLFVKRRARAGNRAAATVVYVLFLTALAAALVLLAPLVVRQLARISVELQLLRELLAAEAPPVFAPFGLEIPLDEILEELEALASQFFRPEELFRMIRAATSNLAWVTLTFVTTYYLLRDWDHLREWLLGLLPEAHRPDARRLHEEIKVVWRAYLRGQLLLMLSVGVLTGLVSAGLGLPGAAALGLLAGALDLIPSLGPTAAAVVAAAVAWFEVSPRLGLANPWFTLVVVIAYALTQVVESLWLQPRILGRVMRLNPGVVFVAVIGALVLGGALMALVIVPVLASVRVVGRYLHRRVSGLAPWPEVEASAAAADANGAGDSTGGHSSS